MSVSSFTVNATVTFIDLEGGFWAIIGSDGTQYRPVSGLPADWQKEGKVGVFTLQEVSDISLFMWGMAVRVIRVN